MGARFDDNWLDDSYTDTTNQDEFIPSDPFEGLTKREQDWFFKMLDVIPEDKREAAMDYFVGHPKKIKEVIAVIKAKKKIVEDKDLVALKTVFSEHRVHLDEPVANTDVLVDDEALASEPEEDNY